MVANSSDGYRNRFILLYFNGSEHWKSSVHLAMKTPQIILMWFSIVRCTQSHQTLREFRSKGDHWSALIRPLELFKGVREQNISNILSLSDKTDRSIKFSSAFEQRQYCQFPQILDPVTNQILQKYLTTVPSQKYFASSDIIIRMKQCSKF